MSAGGRGSAKPLVVDSVGMVSGLGLTSASCCAAIRARISRFSEVPFHDRQGEPIIAAPADEAAPDRQGYRRLAPMLGRAIRECIGPQDRLKTNPFRIPAILAIDRAERPDYPDDLSSRLLREVEAELGTRLSTSSEVILGGRTGFFLGLERARRLLLNPDVQGCIVAGVDSLINTRALRWLEEREQLKTAENADGVIPGEAAAAVWLTNSDSLQGPRPEIAGLGFAEESSARTEGEPNLAIGLAAAIRQALQEAGIGLEEIDFRVAGMTGERTGFKEASLALARLLRARRERFDLWVPAEKLGDVGAALPACMLVLTVDALNRGYAPGDRALLFQSSTSPDRAACVVRMARG